VAIATFSSIHKLLIHTGAILFLMYRYNAISRGAITGNIMTTPALSSVSDVQFKLVENSHLHSRLHISL